MLYKIKHFHCGGFEKTDKNRFVRKQRRSYVLEMSSLACFRSKPRSKTKFTKSSTFFTFRSFNPKKFFKHLTAYFNFVGIKLSIFLFQNISTTMDSVFNSCSSNPTWWWKCFEKIYLVIVDVDRKDVLKACLAKINQIGIRIATSTYRNEKC